MTTTTRLKARRVVASLGAAILAVTLIATGSSALSGQASGQATTAKVEAVGKKTVRLTTGTPGSFMPEQNLFQIKLPKGHYQASMNGLFLYEGTDTSYYLQCLVFDKRLFDNISDPDYTKLFLLDQMSYSDGGTSNNYDGVVEQSNVVSLNKTRSIVYGCVGDENTVQEVPLTVHFTKLAGIDKRNGGIWNPPAPRPAHQKLLRNLLR